MGVVGGDFADSRFFKTYPLGEITRGSLVNTNGQERGERGWGRGNTATRGGSCWLGRWQLKRVYLNCEICAQTANCRTKSCDAAL